MDAVTPFPELRHIAPGFDREAHMPHLDRAPTQYPPFKGRLLGCRVLLLRIEENITASGRFVLPDTYQHGSVMYKVLAVGLGEWVKERKKRRWIAPQVEPGECVVSRHWVQAQDPGKASWHSPQYLDDQGGAGRCIVDSRFLELTWNPKTL
jgi:co-chaperonin GroES (HSP10)